MTDTADTQDKRKRETRRERIVRAMKATPGSIEEVAEAMIAAYPEPHVPKEKDRKPGPNDHCTLFAMRHEFESLCHLVEREAKGKFPGAVALAAALKEQGVVD